MPDLLRKLVIAQLEAARTEAQKAEEILKEQRLEIKALERLLKNLERLEKLEQLGGLQEGTRTSWKEVALRLLIVEMKKNELLEALTAGGFTITPNNLGVWLHRQRKKKVLHRLKHGVYKKV